MSESWFIDEVPNLFGTQKPAPLHVVDLIKGGSEALAVANREQGYALTDDEIDYLVEQYSLIGT